MAQQLFFVCLSLRFHDADCVILSTGRSLTNAVATLPFIILHRLSPRYCCCDRRKNCSSPAEGASPYCLLRPGSDTLYRVLCDVSTAEEECTAVGQTCVWGYRDDPDGRRGYPKASTPVGSVGLVPHPNCTKPGRGVCYQGVAAEVAKAVKLDPLSCQPPTEARLVPYQWYDTDPCLDSGFGEFKGQDPTFPKVELWGCGAACGLQHRRGDAMLECEALQGRKTGPGTYCIGPPKLFGDGTRRNHTIITCDRGIGDGVAWIKEYGICPSGQYCGKGTGDPVGTEQCQVGGGPAPDRCDGKFCNQYCRALSSAERNTSRALKSSCGGFKSGCGEFVDGCTQLCKQWTAALGCVLPAAVGE